MFGHTFTKMGNTPPSVSHHPSAGAGVSSPPPSTTEHCPSRHGPSHLAGIEGTGTSSGNPFVDAMNRMSLGAPGMGETTSENGAPAKSVADLVTDPLAASPLEGLLVALNTSAVGSRGSGKKAKTGLPRAELETFIDDYFRTVVDQAKTNPEEAATFLALFFVHLAYTRDIRDGKGERDLAYWTILRAWVHYPETIRALLPMLTWETYGSFKDLNRLLELCMAHSDAVKDDAAKTGSLIALIEDMWVEALIKDRARLEADLSKADLRSNQKNSYSLAGKWAPRQDSHTAKMCPGLIGRLATRVTGLEGNTGLKAYRRLCAELNRRLQTPELAMCGGAWDTIDPTRISGRCHTMRRDALLNRGKNNAARSEKTDRVACAARFTALYEEVKKNPKVAAEKGLLKTKTLTPLDMIAPFVQHVGSRPPPSPTLEAQWAVFLEAQKARFAAASKSEGGKGLVGGVAIADVSASMSGIPIQACVAFSLFLANIMPEPWHGQMMTFSSDPCWHRIPLDKPLAEQVASIKTAHWQMSTDFGKAMDLVLRTAIENSVPPDQMPQVLYVFTDMQFDAAQSSQHIGHSSNPHCASKAPVKWETVHETIEARFAKAGYQMPFIVYWNLRGNSGYGSPCGKPNYQVSSSTPNTAMLSGFSTTAFDAFCDGDPSAFREATPFERLMRLLDRDVYDRVREVCTRSTEGPLAPYAWTPPPVEVSVDED